MSADIVVAVCGIVGYVGKRPARELLLGGLKKLEYRGYDSAGISLIVEDRIEAVRSVGNLSALQAKLDGARANDVRDEGGAVAVAAPDAADVIGIPPKIQDLSVNDFR